LKGVSLGNLPETAFLVLVADDDGGSDDRIRRQKDARRILQQAVGRAGGELLEFNPDPKAAKDAVRREAAEAGKAMSERSAQVLVEMTGGSLSRALEELQKLIIYVADNPSIGEREILAIAVPSREWSVFRLADAIISNQVALALKQLKILVGSSPKPEDSAFRAILPQLSRTLRLVWQARLCIDAGCSPAEPTSKVLSMFPAKPNLANEQPYRQSQIMGSARKTSLYEVALALQVLSDTDARLKGGLPSFSTVEALERMVLDMAVALNSRRRTG
jgi:DNA polymerase-3 subunit delta